MVPVIADCPDPTAWWIFALYFGGGAFLLLMMVRIIAPKGWLDKPLEKLGLRRV